DLPNVEPVHRRVEPLEALAAIAALVDAVIGTGEHRARLMRMHTQPEDAALAPQPLHDAPPALAAIGAEPQAAADRAGADRVFACHRFLPDSYLNSAQLLPALPLTPTLSPPAGGGEPGGGRLEPSPRLPPHSPPLALPP